jgi:hypothetical protein
MRTPRLFRQFVWVLAGLMSHLICAQSASADDSLATTHPAATQPAAPAWMQKDPQDWPQILLHNKIIFNDGSYELGASATLMRLPNGVVVLGTAKHVLENSDLSKFADVRTWMAFSPLDPTGGVVATRIAFDMAHLPSLDALVLCPKSQYESWPINVLPVRQEPLEPGDTVYLVGVPFKDDSRQRVFKGTVIEPLQDSEWQYDVDGTFVTTGLSGAPVIDSSGRIAAVNIGHMLQQTVPGKMELTCIDTATLLKVIKLPPDIAVAQSNSNSPTTTPSTQPASAESVESIADDALRTAKLLIGRVEMWRGGLGSDLSVSRPFRFPVSHESGLAPFPHPAHRTGRAALPHPALTQSIRSSLASRPRATRAA